MFLNNCLEQILYPVSKFGDLFDALLQNNLEPNYDNEACFRTNFAYATGLK